MRTLKQIHDALLEIEADTLAQSMNDELPIGHYIHMRTAMKHLQIASVEIRIAMENGHENRN